MEQPGTRKLSSANARRDDRVPLDAVVALSFDDGSDVLEADALDVSPQGLSLRANFVPDVGTRLTLRFHCPPHDEPVRALGEVVWGTWQGRDEGLFGMEFLELDTKSATAIRRLLHPSAPAAEPERPKPRLASMRIDGLEVPIEAEVKRADPDCIVLEQDLTFLRLGRGVDVDVKGRGKTRGRIASIELRHGPLDVPTLVFGVLLDGARESAEEPRVRARRVERAAAPTLDAPFAGVEAGAYRHEPAPCAMHRDGDAEEPADTEQRDERADDAQVDAHTDAERQADTHEHALGDAHGDADADAQEDDAAPAEARGLVPSGGVQLAARLRGAVLGMRAKVQHLYARYRERAATGESVFVRAARATGRVSASLQRLLQRRAEPPKRRTTAPARVVRSAAPGKPEQRAPSEAKRPRNHRLIALALAFVGVGIGVYALAPRSGAGRIRAGSYAAPAALPAEARSAPVPVVSALPLEPSAVAAPEPMAASGGGAPAAAEQPKAEPAVFGEPSLENGRTFVLRMSGPVRTIEGEAREDGFTVRVPGRLALDRASPIAASHRAVARAMVLNRGEYAELTVDFLPGMRPKYQVVGKDAALEITLQKP